MPTMEMPIVSPDTHKRAGDMIRERVQRGASMLDASRPGWRDEIDKRILSMASAYGCILGQLFDEGPFATSSGYAIGARSLGIWDEEHIVDGRSIPATVHCGFAAGSPWQYAYMLREWLRLLP